ncbi:hypothetical protein F53441_9297 [Fusarium austroafricanum]|uniref:AB hydrolase-1 domain-containing protein n=1 Tax=Fusarium austroafricanum TaxID=2364996 RepID=A0A8H4P3L8_9HYPO|nr:hypothetical protein F53441_9297 [Fusarium austroafricanum]
MKVKKARHPDKYLRHILRPGSLQAFDYTKDGSYEYFIRITDQRTWKDPEEYASVIERACPDHTTQIAILIGIPEGAVLDGTIKPALIIVPGNFSLPRFWSAIQQSVQKQGYPVEVVGLQSSREQRVDPAPGLAEDVKEATSVLNKHIDQGKDVVLLMHSYGGMVGTEATRGLSRIEREKAGLKGGIVRLVFLAAVFAPPGKSTRGLYKANPGRYPSHDGDWLVCDEDTAMCFYSDLTKEQGLHLAQAATKVSQAVRVFSDEQTYDGFHKLIPSSYILTLKDILVPEPAQRQFISRLEENGERSVPVVEIDTAHSPHQTDPPLLMKVLDKILEVEEKEG